MFEWRPRFSFEFDAWHWWRRWVSWYRDSHNMVIEFQFMCLMGSFGLTRK